MRFFPEFDDAHTAQPLLVAYTPDHTICCKTEQLKCRILFSSSPTAFLVRHPDATARVCAAASETSLCLSAFRAAPQRNPRLTGGGTLRQFWLTGGLRSPPAGLALVAHCPKKKKKRKKKGKKRESITLKLGESCNPSEVSPVEIIITEGYLVEYFCKW